MESAGWVVAGLLFIGMMLDMIRLYFRGCDLKTPSG